MMKNSVLGLFFLIASVSSFAQNSEAYKAHNEGWIVKMEDAIALSNKTGKPIMANFTGSDWCGWCTKLTNDVFSKQDFKQWAEKNVVLLELDYPRRKQLPDDIKQQNANLQQAFQVAGYPTVWLFHLTEDKENNKFNIEALGKLGYMQDPKSFISAAEGMIKQGKASK
jgi:thioredoxin-related protein